MRNRIDEDLDRAMDLVSERQQAREEHERHPEDDILEPEDITQDDIDDVIDILGWKQVMWHRIDPREIILASYRVVNKKIFLYG